LKVLLDHNIPHALRSRFPEECEVHTAQYRGWEDVDDKKLLTAAEEEGYGVFVTLDSSLPAQQNLEDRAIGIVVLDVHPATPSRLEARMDEVNDHLTAVAEDEKLLEIS